MTAPSAAAPTPAVAGPSIETPAPYSPAETQNNDSPVSDAQEAISSEPEPANADSSLSKEPDSDSPEPEPPAAAPEVAATASTCQFLCPHCGQGLEVETALAGQSGECPLCGKPIVVPSPG